MKGELLPCPFCGGEAATIESGERFYVVCCNVDCFCALGEAWDRDAMPDHAFADEEAAVAAWNTRAPSDLTAQLDKAREALERAKSDILDLPYTNRNGDLSRQRTAACERIDAARACLPATSGDGAATHPDHPFEDLSDALAACERIRDESTHAQSLPEGYLLGFRAGSNGCVVALLNLIGFRTRALAPKGLQL